MSTHSSKVPLSDLKEPWKSIWIAVRMNVHPEPTQADLDGFEERQEALKSAYRVYQSHRQFSSIPKELEDQVNSINQHKISEAFRWEGDVPMEAISTLLFTPCLIPRSRLFSVDWERIPEQLSSKSTAMQSCDFVAGQGSYAPDDKAVKLQIQAVDAAIRRMEEQETVISSTRPKVPLDTFQYLVFDPAWEAKDPSGGVFPVGEYDEDDDLWSVD